MTLINFANYLSNKNDLFGCLRKLHTHKDIKENTKKENCFLDTTSRLYKTLLEIYWDSYNKITANKKGWAKNTVSIT